MTLECWSIGLVLPATYVCPHAWVSFVPFTVVTTFAVINLLVGFIVQFMKVALLATEPA